MNEFDALLCKQVENNDLPYLGDEVSDTKELPNDKELNDKPIVDSPDIPFIERISRSALMEQCSLKASENTDADDSSKSEGTDEQSEGLTEEEKAKIKEETGWSDEIIDNIKNMMANRTATTLSTVADTRTSNVQIPVTSQSTNIIGVNNSFKMNFIINASLISDFILPVNMYFGKDVNTNDTLAEKLTAPRA